jgi:hypothetical protein
MSRTHTLSGANGSGYDAVSWGSDVDNTTDQTIKSASGSGTSDVPGWIPSGIAALGIIGAFAFGMWLMGRESNKLGALSTLTNRYKNLLGVSQEPSGIVLVRFIDESGKEQVHDWYFDGKNWRCGRTGEIE